MIQSEKQILVTTQMSFFGSSIPRVWDTSPIHFLVRFNLFSNPRSGFKSNVICMVYTSFFKPDYSERIL